MRAPLAQPVLCSVLPIPSVSGRKRGKGGELWCCSRTVRGRVSHFSWLGAKLSPYESPWSSFRATYVMCCL